MPASFVRTFFGNCVARCSATISIIFPSRKTYTGVFVANPNCLAFTAARSNATPTLARSERGQKGERGKGKGKGSGKGSSCLLYNIALAMVPHAETSWVRLGVRSCNATYCRDRLSQIQPSCQKNVSGNLRLERMLFSKRFRHLFLPLSQITEAPLSFPQKTSTLFQ